jgi:hypothetical protein
VIWSKCPEGLVYKGIGRPEHRRLVRDEDAVYIDIANGIVWTKGEEWPEENSKK